MENIKELITFVMDNKEELIKMVAYVIAVATVVVKFTPTPKDDAILGKIKKFISKYIALNV